MAPAPNAAHYRTVDFIEQLIELLCLPTAPMLPVD
jgi:hypothetical protein